MAIHDVVVYFATAGAAARRHPTLQIHTEAAPWSKWHSERPVWLQFLKSMKLHVNSFSLFCHVTEASGRGSAEVSEKLWCFLEGFGKSGEALDGSVWFWMHWVALGGSVCF